MKSTLPLCILFVVSSLSGCVRTISRTPDESVERSRSLTAQGYRLYDEQQFDRAREAFEEAIALRPNHPGLVYALAAANAALGRSTESLRWLSLYAAMGLYADLGKEAAFSNLRDVGGFPEIKKTIMHNNDPVGTSRLYRMVADRGTLPETIAYDPVEKRFFVGCIFKKKIVVVDSTGASKDFLDSQSGLWSVTGLAVDAVRRSLWIATSELPQMEGGLRGELRRTKVLRFDLLSGNVDRIFFINDSAGHVLGDLIVSSAGDVWMTDSEHPAVLKIEQGTTEITTVTEGKPLVSPQGLSFSDDERFIFLADYPRGIYRMDCAAGSMEFLTTPSRTTLVGIDGLRFVGKRLIAIQNGTRPHRLLEISLNDAMDVISNVRVLEANNPLFDEPTNGVIAGGNFYYIADSQWRCFEEGKIICGEGEQRGIAIMTLSVN